MSATTNTVGWSWKRVGRTALALTAAVLLAALGARTARADNPDALPLSPPAPQKHVTGTAPTALVPAAPANVIARGGAAGVQLAWIDRAPDENRYDVRSSIDGATWMVRTLPANTTLAIDSRPSAPGVARRYEVRACRTDVCSAPATVTLIP